MLIIFLLLPVVGFSQQYWNSDGFNRREMKRLAMMPNVSEYTVERTYPHADSPYVFTDKKNKRHRFYQKESYINSMGEDKTGIIRHVKFERRNDSILVTEGSVHSRNLEDIEPGMRYLLAYVFNSHGKILYQYGREYRYDPLGYLSEERDLMTDSPGYYLSLVHHPNAKGKDTLIEEYYGSDLAKRSYTRICYDEVDSVTKYEVYNIRYPQKDYILANGTMKFVFSADHRIKRMMLAGGKNYAAIPDSFFYNGMVDTFFIDRKGHYLGKSSNGFHYTKDDQPLRFLAKGEGYDYDETYLYDERGNISEIVWYSDLIKYREVFTYDKEGKPLRQIRYSPDGLERRVLKYSYTYK